MTYKLIEKVSFDAGQTGIPYSHYQLDNGLTVLIHEDQGDPLVHLELCYHVGSGREEIGKSGFAHFFEHMMFEGSKHVANNEHFRIVSEAGGSLNGSTNRDRTNYYETVPVNHLEEILWLESDRMGYLLQALTKESFENQRSVVKNEKSQRYENQPYGMLAEKTQENLYPENHPYSWTTIGYTEDLDRVSPDDVKEFFKEWYGPNNAVLVLGGDVKAEGVIELVAKYFGPIPAAPEKEPPEPIQVRLEADRYTSYQDQVRFPLLQMVWPTVPVYHPDEAALDVLSDILSNSKNSYLYQSLVKPQIAVQAHASHYCYEQAGEFRIMGFAYPGKSLSEIKAEVHRAFEQMKENGISQKEVDRARTKYYAQVLYNLETNKSKVGRLASYWTMLRNPNYIEQDIERYKSLTADDVMRVFEKYLYGQHVLHVSFYQKGQENLLPGEDNQSFERRGLDKARLAQDNVEPIKITDDIDRTKRPRAGAVPANKAPDYYRFDAPNGLKVIGTTQRESPTVSLSLFMDAGSIYDPEGKSGLAALYSEMVGESSLNFSSELLHERLERLASMIQVSNTKERLIFKLTSLKENFAETIDILREELLFPAFEESELNRIKTEHLEMLAFQDGQVDMLANRGIYAGLYGKDHPYGRPASGLAGDVATLEADDLRNFQKDFVLPEGAICTVSGDISDEELKAQAQFLFNEWQGKPAPKSELPESAPQKGRIVIRHKENAAQSVIRIGHLSIPWDAFGDYFKSNVMNYPLGASFNSRINLNLREDKGMTYGARADFYGSRLSGSYLASASVSTADTATAIKEFLKEFKLYREHGMTEEEWEFTKKSILNRDALRYESNGQKAAFLKRLLEYDLPEDYIVRQKLLLEEITVNELNALAGRMIKPEEFLIVVAGDQHQIAGDLKALDVGEVLIEEIESDLKS